MRPIKPNEKKIKTVEAGDYVMLHLHPPSGGDWIPEYLEWAKSKRVFRVIGEHGHEKVWILEGKSAFNSDLIVLERKATFII
jgi:hypothetical protein